MYSLMSNTKVSYVWEKKKEPYTSNCDIDIYLSFFSNTPKGFVSEKEATQDDLRNLPWVKAD